jgi:hypothetical protein
MVTLSDRVTALHISPIRRVAALLAEANKRKELISQLASAKGSL